MDAIGAIASVAQLTSYLVGSLAYAFEVYQKVKSRPEKLRLQFREVEVLRFIVIEIRKIPALHKPNIQSQLHSLTDFVGSLVAVLNKLLAQQSRILAKRFLKIWIKDTENVRLESILTTIERQKNSLILSIATVQTDLQSVLLRFCVRKRIPPVRKLQKNAIGGKEIGKAKAVPMPRVKTNGPPGSTSASTGANDTSSEGSQEEPKGVDTGEVESSRASEELKETRKGNIFEYENPEFAEESNNFHGCGAPGHDKYKFLGSKYGARSSNYFGIPPPYMAKQDSQRNGKSS